MNSANSQSSNSNIPQTQNSQTPNSQSHQETRGSIDAERSQPIGRKRAKIESRNETVDSSFVHEIVNAQLLMLEKRNELSMIQQAAKERENKAQMEARDKDAKIEFMLKLMTSPNWSSLEQSPLAQNLLAKIISSLEK